MRRDLRKAKGPKLWWKDGVNGSWRASCFLQARDPEHNAKQRHDPMWLLLHSPGCLKDGIAIVLKSKLESNVKGWDDYSPDFEGSSS